MPCTNNMNNAAAECMLVLTIQAHHFSHSAHSVIRPGTWNHDSLTKHSIMQNCLIIQVLIPGVWKTTWKMYNPYLGLYIAAALGVLMLCFIYCVGKSKLRKCWNDICPAKNATEYMDMLEPHITRDARVTFASTTQESHPDVNYICVVHHKDLVGPPPWNEYPEDVTYKILRKCSKNSKLLLDGDVTVHILEVDPDCPLHGGRWRGLWDELH